MRRALQLALLAVVVACLAAPAFAGTITVYNGLDNGVKTGPNSTNAANSFATAIGLASYYATTPDVTFEGLAVNHSFTSGTVAPGVTVTMTGTDTSGLGGVGGISNDSSNTTLGFNTTPGGTTFLQVVPQFRGPNVDVTFSFTNPINAFGAFLGGTETTIDGTITLNFSDGTSQTLLIPKNTTAGVEFYGFTDAGASIASVTFTEAGPFDPTRDIWSIDDIRFAAVPEPASLALLGAGLLGVGYWIRRKQ